MGSMCTPLLAKAIRLDVLLKVEENKTYHGDAPGPGIVVLQRVAVVSSSKYSPISV